MHSFLPADNICRVEGKIVKVADKIIWLSYFALAAVTPLVFSTQNSELFEVPKMHFVYLLATIIFFSTLIKVSLGGKILVPKSLPLAAFSIFFLFQIFSTLTSIDKFTSVFGYPTRLNGGLLSQASYFVILACAFMNLNPSRAKKLLMTIVITALAVALWGIPGHFGRDPSCLILTGKLTSTCWQKFWP
ncbi:hypothetical protein HYS90_00220 [Candidatus Curtissbacteria bacterium]|nr:hypothetical protein [Candidatus Curtissbacteria bacterium]